MKFRVISLFCILVSLSFFLYSCAGCEEMMEKERQEKKLKEQEQLEQQKENEFQMGDKVTVKVFTSTGEKTYEGTFVKEWDRGVIIKKDRKILIAIHSQTYEIERQQ